MWVFIGFCVLIFLMIGAAIWAKATMPEVVED